MDTGHNSAVCDTFSYLSTAQNRRIKIRTCPYVSQMGEILAVCPLHRTRGKNVIRLGAAVLSLISTEQREV